MYFISLFAALAALSNTASSASSQAFLDTFEDKPRGSVQAGTGTPVGIENGLFYNGFVVGTDIAGVGGGIIAQSQPNVAASGGPIGMNGTSTITIDYPNSKVKSFDLLEMYYGCSVNDQTNAGTAQSCVLGVTGFYTNGQRFSTQAIAFGFPYQGTSATGLVAQPMQRYIFLGLVSIRNATFTFTAAPGLDAIAASYFQFDNVRHINYY